MYIWLRQCVILCLFYEVNFQKSVSASLQGTDAVIVIGSTVIVNFVLLDFWVQLSSVETVSESSCSCLSTWLRGLSMLASALTHRPPGSTVPKWRKEGSSCSYGSQAAAAVNYQSNFVFSNALLKLWRPTCAVRLRLWNYLPSEAGSFRNATTMWPTAISSPSTIGLLESLTTALTTRIITLCWQTRRGLLISLHTSTMLWPTRWIRHR